MAVFLKKEYQLDYKNLRLNKGKSGQIRFLTPEDFGECYSDHIELARDFNLIYLRYSPVCNLTIKESNNPHNSQVLVITLGLHGKSCYETTQPAPTVNFTTGYTTINAFNRCTGQRQYKSGETTAQLRLVIGEKLLRQYIGEKSANSLLGIGQLNQLLHQKTSPTSLSHASILVRHINYHSTGVNKLMLHTHSLCLLSELVSVLLPQPKRNGQKLSQDEIQKLEHVQDIMLQQMEKPLTEEYLCTIVGMNKCKLREGFSYLFNTTPHKMLLEIRMRKAHLMLELGYQVAQTAWSVGYGHPNNFSIAFSNFFGYSPKFIYQKQ
ncbi:helix-turn-helix transcriptional regulator [Salmonella enterica]|nr:AraC family transcriptional regulator [Salmonella enterica]EBT4079082.1 helix-turn-helix transcriptional regulator [Salmonella enterica]EGE4752518.1 helix-turn-helix transcriptional regulator [Salmonella enterica subsp. diarizonae serovar 38:[k]:z35]